MTLAFNIAPDVARDFALMIQTVGMLSASFTICFQRIVVDWPAIVWCSLGGAISTPAGLAVRAVRHLSPALHPALLSPLARTRTRTC